MESTDIPEKTDMSDVIDADVEVTIETRAANAPTETVASSNDISGEVMRAEGEGTDSVWVSKADEPNTRNHDGHCIATPTACVDRTDCSKDIGL